jgi:transcriptional regulator with XRE-family HTH domain
MKDSNRFGLRLRALRVARNLTQEALAAKLGRSTDAVSNLERGKSLPNFETIELLCNALGIEPKQLFDFAPSHMSPRQTKLIDTLLATAYELPEADLELAVEQVQAIRKRGR